MHFSTKNYLKYNRYHTAKHIRMLPSKFVLLLEIPKIRF
jgi:hypothetical protein